MKSNKIKLQLKKENSEANKNADKQTDGRLALFYESERKLPLYQGGGGPA